MRRWLLCPFGVSHKEVAIVTIRSKVEETIHEEVAICSFGVCHEEVAL